jgi:hypothetical protein
MENEGKIDIITNKNNNIIIKNNEEISQIANIIKRIAVNCFIIHVCHRNGYCQLALYKKNNKKTCTSTIKILRLIGG